MLDFFEWKRPKIPIVIDEEMSILALILGSWVLVIVLIVVRFTSEKQSLTVFSHLESRFLALLMAQNNSERH
jgi:hypothetical protein